MSDVRKVNSYTILSTTRLAFPLTLPAFIHPISGVQVEASALYGDTPLGSATAYLTSMDGTRIMLSGEWTFTQAIGLALLSQADGTGGTVLNHTEVRAILATPEWTAQEEA